MLESATEVATNPSEIPSITISEINERNFNVLVIKRSYCFWNMCEFLIIIGILIFIQYRSLEKSEYIDLLQKW
jgi:hypothetical protein